MSTKIGFLGDFYNSSDQNPNIGLSLKENLEKLNYLSVNFEAPVVDLDCLADKKVGPSLRMGENSVEFCKKIGITHFSLANNHIMDYGVHGLRSTLDKLGNQRVIGAGLSIKDCYKPIIIERENIKIALFSFAETQFGSCGEIWDENQFGYASISSSNARKNIIQYKSLVNYIIVQVHAGLENCEIALPELRLIYREFIDLGADLIIGHHPHILQGFESYKNKKIFYSIGNFYMNYDGNYGTGGLLTVEVDECEIRSDISVLKITSQSIDVDKNQDSMKIDNLCHFYKDDVLYMKLIDQICAEEWKKNYSRLYAESILGLGFSNYFSNIIHILKKIINKIIKRNVGWDRKLLLLHNVQIESHRWVSLRLLRKK